MNQVRRFITWGLYLTSGVAFALPSENPGVMTHGELIRIVMALVFVLSIIVLLSWLVKRLNLVNLSSSKGFQSIANMGLGPKERVVLLKVGERYLLVGVGAGAVSMLYDFGKEMPEGFELGDKPSFAEFLKSAVRKS